MQTTSFPAGVYARANTAAGLSLTEADYRHAGVQGLVYSLARMLMRPGLDRLGYWRAGKAWRGLVLVDASDLTVGAAQSIRLRNDYDGSLIQHDLPVIATALNELELDGLLVPPDADLSLLQAYMRPDIALFVPKASDQYSQYSPEAPESGHVRLVSDRECLLQLYKNTLLLTDIPVRDAVAGIIYNPDTCYDITDSSLEYDQQPLAQNCQCSACASGMTRSYFHHLFPQAPLLCHRWLAMHNLQVAAARSYLFEQT